MIGCSNPPPVVHDESEIMRQLVPGFTTGPTWQDDFPEIISKLDMISASQSKAEITLESLEHEQSGIIQSLSNMQEELRRLCVVNEKTRHTLLEKEKTTATASQSLDWEKSELVRLDSCKSLERAGSRSPTAAQTPRETPRGPRSSNMFDFVPSRLSNQTQSGISHDQERRLPAAHLPANWPACIQIYKQLDPDITISKSLPSQSSFRRHITRNHQPDQSHTLTATSSLVEMLDLVYNSVGPGRLYSNRGLDPNSNIRLVWDALSIVALLFDFIITPYVLAWDRQFHGVLKTASWTISTFWALDIVGSFITGFYNHGELETRLPRIAKHYVRTWFPMDFILVLCDWMSNILFALTSQANATNTTAEGFTAARLVKLGRFLRMTRALRMAQAARAFDRILDNVAWSSMRVMLQMLTVFLGVLLLCHIVSCCWFAIGRLAASDTGRRWLDFETGFMYHTDKYQYAAAFLWSMCQITGAGEAEMFPVNTVERYFNIVILIVGLLFGSLFVSLMVATMTELIMLKQEQEGKLKQLRKFLHQNSVYQGTAVRVQKQVIERLSENKALKDTDVDVLSLLSNTLKMELRYEMFRDHLVTHPLFSLWSSLDTPIFKQLCHKAAEFHYLSTRDDLFIPGAAVTEAYHVIRGEMSYSSPTACEPNQPVRKDFGPGDWLCESALWTKWTAIGHLEAKTYCQVLGVSGESLMQVMQRHEVVKDITTQYGFQFHQRLISSRPPYSLWPTDVYVPFTDFGEIVASMVPPTASVVAEATLRKVYANSYTSFHHRLTLKDVNKLLEDVSHGLCTLASDSSGDVFQVICATGVRVRRSDGHVLAAVDDRDHIAYYTVPEVAHKFGELPGDALERLLAQLFEGLRNQIRVHTFDQEERFDEAQGGKLRKKYYRTCFDAEINDNDIDLPAVNPPPGYVFVEIEEIGTVQRCLSAISSAPRRGQRPSVNFASAFSEKTTIFGVNRPSGGSANPAGATPAGHSSPTTSPPRPFRISRHSTASLFTRPGSEVASREDFGKGAVFPSLANSQDIPDEIQLNMAI